MKIAIIHDWLNLRGGAEKTLESLLRVFPDADVFTLFNSMKGADREHFGSTKIRTSFAQRLPFVSRLYRLYLPIFCFAVEQIDLAGYDVVLSSSHAVAKGVLTRADQLHICLCYTPMRYAWDQYSEYMSNERSRILRSLLARIFLHRIRLWDLRTANGVDLFVGISAHVSQRIWKVYRRESLVVYPPVQLPETTSLPQKDDYYVTVSRLVSQKHIARIIEAFIGLDRKLVVIGNGPEMKHLAKLRGDNIRLVGRVPYSELLKYLQGAKAFVHAAEEDFGIAPIEAQALGTPVVAYAKGALGELICDTDGLRSGVLFHERTPEAIRRAIRKFEDVQDQISPHICRESARSFSESVFMEKIARVVEDAWKVWNSDAGPKSLESEMLARHAYQPMRKVVR